MHGQAVNPARPEGSNGNDVLPSAVECLATFIFSIQPRFTAEKDWSSTRFFAVSPRILTPPLSSSYQVIARKWRRKNL